MKMNNLGGRIMEYNENIKVRKVTTIVKGMEIVFDEYYKVDLNTGKEIFDRELEIKNDINLYDIYKEKSGLLTSIEIKKIRNKYNLNQKDYALAIGVGEVTINRIENGSIQTEATDAIIRLSKNPNNMKELLIRNKENITQKSYDIAINSIYELLNLNLHKIANFDKEKLLKLNFNSENINDITNNLIKKYNEKNENTNKEYNIDLNPGKITQLKLQKLLYYIQGLALHIYNKPAFNEKIFAWSYGPVVSEVYHEYKVNGRDEITTPKKINLINEGMNAIIDLVIQDYGKYEAEVLVDLTHKETPWKETEINKEITKETIKSYFDKIYQI